MWPLLFRFCKSVADTPPAGGRRLARRGMLQGLAPGPDVARGQQAEGRTGQQMGAPVAREAEYDAQAAGGQQRNDGHKKGRTKKAFHRRKRLLIFSL